MVSRSVYFRHSAKKCYCMAGNGTRETKDTSRQDRTAGSEHGDARGWGDNVPVYGNTQVMNGLNYLLQSSTWTHANEHMS